MWSFETIIACMATKRIYFVHVLDDPGPIKPSLSSVRYTKATARPCGFLVVRKSSWLRYRTRPDVDESQGADVDSFHVFPLQSIVFPFVSFYGFCSSRGIPFHPVPGSFLPRNETCKLRLARLFPWRPMSVPNVFATAPGVVVRISATPYPTVALSPFSVHHTRDSPCALSC